MINSNKPTNPFYETETKDNNFDTQIKIVFNAFKRNPSSMLMVAVHTDIFRANICRYIAKWRKAGSVQLLKKGFCKITKRYVGFYTTDANLFAK